MAILEEAVYGSDPLTPSEALEEVRRLGLETKGDSAHLIRIDRDAR